MFKNTRNLSTRTYHLTMVALFFVISQLAAMAQIDSLNDGWNKREQGKFLEAISIANKILSKTAEAASDAKRAKELYYYPD